MELDLKYFLPETTLLITACVVTLLGLAKSDATRKLTQLLALLGTVIAAVFVFTVDYTGAFPHATHFSPNYITGLACAIGFLTILASWNSPFKNDPSTPDANYRGEFFGMLLFSLAGVAMIGKVNDLVWLFIALELVSIPTYILVATGRSQIIAQEAGVKYFFLGALAAAVFVFGFSYLYGATGFTRFTDIHDFFNTHGFNTPLALIGMLMVILGVSFKMAAVPFHFYTPDVYQGASTPVTAYLAFAPKAAGLIAIISMLSLIDFNYTTSYGNAVMSVLTVMAVLTMSVGNVLALLQRNIKRIFAYSSIAHSGYMLVGLVAGISAVHTDGVDASIFYLTSYAIMNLGAFAALIYLQGKADAAEDLDDLAGVAKEHPFAALLFALCLFSLIGMPLTIGFLGKLYLISASLASGHTALAVILVINAAIAAAYYLKIIAAMYLRDPLYPFAVRRAIPIKITALVCTLAVIVFFFIPGPLIKSNLHDPAKTPAEPKVITASAR